MMKPKYKIGEAFSFAILPNIIIITGVIIRKDRCPIYEMSRIDSDTSDTRKLYGYYSEEELAALKYIEV